MNISLLSVGTEILLGDTVNTNLSSLGQNLYNNGYLLTTERTVSDDKLLIKKQFNQLLEESDVVITCGGLGPTEDDFTKEVISDFLNLELVIDEEHLSWMRARWANRGIIMPETNVKQAEIPIGATKLTNTTGTAPGIYIEYKAKHIFILPGPPREFNPLVIDEVIPFLNKHFEQTSKSYEFILFYNQAESALAEEIDKFKPNGIDIAYLASKGIIKLRYDKSSVSMDEIELFKKNIHEKLGKYVLSTQNVSSSRVLLSKLKDKDMKLSIVESVTGGRLSSELVKNPGASDTLIASNTLYSMESKVQFLNTKINDDWKVLTENLAIESQKKYNSEISLAILGEAGPTVSSDYKLGQIFISIVSNNKKENFEHNLRGNREDIINRAVNNAIWDLINFIK